MELSSNASRAKVQQKSDEGLMKIRQTSDENWTDVQQKSDESQTDVDYDVNKMSLDRPEASAMSNDLVARDVAANNYNSTATRGLQ